MKHSNYIISIIIFILLLPGCSSQKPVSGKSEIVQNVINSKIIDGNINITVYLPGGYGSGEKYPVLYTLHGASGGEWSWFEDLNAGSCADRLMSLNRIKPMIIVSTKTLNNLTMTDSDGQNRESDLFERYVCEELVPYIDSHYDTIKSNKSRYIGGVSLGGFVALQIGLHNPQIFGKVGGHSPASWLYDYSDDAFDSWLYPGETLNSNRDLVKYAREKGLSDIKVFLDCGENDYGIVDDTKKIHEALIKRGISSTCIISEGDHSSEYWAANMEKYLEFYNK
ncbi:MAG TPA: alpha/beta hydrolase-fold protein [Pseudobacteroides sp.]|nr:alpha/beta hydrolase-fold protein [Pseudobacteroides sp.]